MNTSKQKLKSNFINIQIYPFLNDEKIEWYIGTSEWNKQKINNDYTPRPAPEILSFVKHIMKSAIMDEIESLGVSCDDLDLEEISLPALERLLVSALKDR